MEELLYRLRLCTFPHVLYTVRAHSVSMGTMAISKINVQFLFLHSSAWNFACT